MSHFIFECPLCGEKMTCDENLENQVVQCPQCNGEIVPTQSTVQRERTNQASQTGRTKQTTRTAIGQPEQQKNTEFKKPILTFVFNAVGFVHLAVGCLLVILGFVEFGSIDVVIVGAALAATSIFPFGFAQVVYYIGRISYNTERTANLLRWK